MPKVKFPKQEFFHCNVTHDDEKYNSRENILAQVCQTIYMVSINSSVNLNVCLLPILVKYKTFKVKTFFTSPLAICRFSRGANGTAPLLGKC